MGNDSLAAGNIWELPDVVSAPDAGDVTEFGRLDSAPADSPSTPPALDLETAPNVHPFLTSGTYRLDKVEQNAPETLQNAPGRAIAERVTTMPPDSAGTVLGAPRRSPSQDFQDRMERLRMAGLRWLEGRDR